jgi:hypothetical protein
MHKVVKNGTCEPDNTRMDVALETLTHTDVGLNAASSTQPLLKRCVKRHLDETNYFAVEKMQFF